MTRQFTTEELARCIAEQYAGNEQGVTEQVNRWLARGDGVAVYQNHDFSHQDAGDIRLASYGSTAALLETGEPPAILPDTPQQINWRYALTGTYRGSPLPLPRGPEEAG